MNKSEENKFNAKKEKNKLNKILKNISPDRKKLVEGLVADVSFMAEHLEKLRDYINEHGVSEDYQNGANQHGKKTSPEAEMYIKIQKSYAAVIKQLSDYVDAENGSTGDKFLEFIRK